jgi:DNA-binding CsgD family transcriptional regulator
MTASSLRSPVSVHCSSNTWEVKLRDPFRRVLDHLAVVIGEALSVTALEIRVYERPGERLAAMVRIPSNERTPEGLSSWPASELAFRTEVRSTLRPQHAFQPGGWTGSESSSTDESTGVDILCSLDDLGTSYWCIITACRDRRHGRFSQADRRLLESLMPTMSEQILEQVAPLHERLDRRISQVTRQYELTDAEVKVASYLIGSTLSEQDIARELHRSFNTIHRHVTNIYRKLGVRSRLEALALAEVGQGLNRTVGRDHGNEANPSAA